MNLSKQRNQQIFQDIERELVNAKRKHPNWPDHPAAQAGVVSEESGELMQACMQYKYERSSDPEKAEKQRQAMYDEAVQVAASAIRFLQNLKP